MAQSPMSNTTSTAATPCRRMLPPHMLMLPAILLLAVLMLALPHRATAQEYTFRRYGINDGLPFLRVNCCMQDQRGFMWFGTDLGLASFDGTRFCTAIPFKDGPLDLRGTIVSCLLQDRDGLLWIGTSKGLFTYNIATDHLEHMCPNGWDIKTATSLMQDAEGAIWVIAPDAFYRLDYSNSKYQRFLWSDHFVATNFVFSRSGIIWVLSADGCIYQYQPQTQRFTPFRIMPLETEHRQRVLLKGIEREDGKILLMTSRGEARLFTPTTKQVEALTTNYAGETNVITHALMKRTENEYWIGTETGVYVWTPSGPQAGMHHLKKDPSDNRSLSDNAVHDLCQDKEGGIWVATSFGGVCYMGSDHSAFSRIELTGSNNRVECNVVRSIIPDASGLSLWIGAEDGGIYRYDTQTGTIHSFDHLRWQGKPLPNNIQSLLLLGNTLWIGNFDGSIYLYDIAADRITDRITLPQAFPVDMFADRNGHIYIATTAGLFEANPKPNPAQTILTPVKGVPAGFMHHLAEDHEGNIWLASLGKGVWRRDAQSKAWKKVNIPDSYVCTIFEDSRGTIWAGSIHNGLYRYDTVTGQASAMQNIHNQRGMGVYRIIEDNRGVLWLTTNNGLYSYDPTTEDVIRYGLSPILSSPQFNFNSGYMDAAGKVYLGSLDGMLTFSPEMMKNPEVDLTVYFTDYINEGTSFGVCFSVPVYSIQQTLWFRYRLKGIDKDWTVVQGQRDIRYSNLPYGTYTLEVEASIQEGSWENNVSQLSIVIPTPWYATTLARCIMVLLLAIVAVFSWRRYRLLQADKHRNEAERQRIERDRELSQEKMRFFTTITHEIRTPLTLILAPVKSLLDSFSAQKAQLMLPAIYRNASELLNLVNQILDYRKLEQGRATINLSHGDFNEFCLTIMDLFREMAQKKHINFTTSISAPLYMNFDKEKMQRVLVNLLSNAFKFTPEQGHISLGTRVVGRQCEISVSDNGVGIAPDDLPHVFDLFYQTRENRDPRLENQMAVGSGIGLHLVREYVSLHKGQVSVESRQQADSGTTFTIVLPTDLVIPNDHTDAAADDIAPDSPMLPVVDDEEEPNLTAGDHKPAILLVDDNEELRQYLYIELSSQYTILQAANGQEALNLALENEVDIVVSDIMMPVMDGIELCQRLKENVRTSHLFVILLTAKVGEQHRLTGYKAGADYYIFKPFNIDILRNRIAYLYSLRQKRHDMFLKNADIASKDITNSELDEELYNKAVQLVNQNMDNEAYSVEQFASDMCMSRMTLYRKVSSITGQKPLEFIRAIRLKKAIHLLQSTDRSILEIAEMVGFGTARNFSKNFKAVYGVSPTAYKKGEGNAPTANGSSVN